MKTEDSSSSSSSETETEINEEPAYVSTSTVFTEHIGTVERSEAMIDDINETNESNQEDWVDVSIDRYCNYCWHYI